MSFASAIKSRPDADTFFPLYVKSLYCGSDSGIMITYFPLFLSICTGLRSVAFNAFVGWTPERAHKLFASTTSLRSINFTAPLSLLFNLDLPQVTHMSISVLPGDAMERLRVFLQDPSSMPRLTHISITVWSVPQLEFLFDIATDLPPELKIILVQLLSVPEGLEEKISAVEDPRVVFLSLGCTTAKGVVHVQDGGGKRGDWRYLGTDDEDSWALAEETVKDRREAIARTRAVGRSLFDRGYCATTPWLAFEDGDM